MKILYIHGLDSSPSEEKLAIIRKLGHTPVAPHLDYRTDKTCYAQLLQLAKDENVEFIIGSSLGGYFGYWLGQKLGIGQLLFNPAMPFRSVQVQVNTDIVPKEGVKSWVVLGLHDEVIPANLNQSFFEGRDHAQVVTCNWLGHRTDEATFEAMMRWANLSA